jgi:hypothetical protein
MPAEEERDCPRCGHTTTVHVEDDPDPIRECDNAGCPWYLIIQGCARA